jgi:isopropylmalate/homocitrate/citramalate synthase
MIRKTRSDAFPGARTGRIEAVRRQRPRLPLTDFPAAEQAIVGIQRLRARGAFHQHGMLCNAKTYEIMVPRTSERREAAWSSGTSRKHAFEKQPRRHVLLPDDGVDRRELRALQDPQRQKIASTDATSKARDE